MSESDRPPNLVVLYPEPDEHDDATPATKTDRAGAYCAHRKINLDEEARRVTCRDCGLEVDAFGVILSWANDWKRITEWRREAERRRKRAYERLEEILRLEKNARARLKKIDAPAERTVEKPWGEGMPV